jgi:hypothetical protein
MRERNPVTNRPRLIPKDGLARDRLRAAQAAEAQAVSTVYAAEDALVGVRRKRDDALAKADAAVAKAELVVAAAQAGLVTVSGLDRAARLLGHEKFVLRKAMNAGGHDKGPS